MINPAIPEALSIIVLKLLDKSPENRYQSANGLHYDLEKCFNELQQTGSIKTFNLATQDNSLIFYVPLKLYGREREIHKLLDCFKEVCNGNNCFMMVAGYSGIGKTAIINEIHKPITETRGLYATGKSVKP